MKRYTGQEMECLVDLFAQSGMSQRRFCDQQGIKLPTFSYWYRKLGKSTTPSCPGFVELERPTASCSGLEVVFPNGVVVRGIRDLALVRELVTL